MPRLKPVLTPFFLTFIVAGFSAAPLLSLSATPASLVTSSVKLRVDAPGGHSWGTGTIIDTRQGPEGQEALILTCGHIFRESQGQGNVEVHLYGENSTVRVYGRCLHYDLEIDLALVIVAPPGPVRAVPIAPDDYRIQPSQQAWSIGCDHGGNPTMRTHQVMSVDKLSTPREHRKLFWYVQVSGAPVGGCSGGGLFSAEGYLIGVCNAADPIVNDGHFVPPQMIRHILDERGLGFVYQNQSLGESQRQTQPLTELAALTPLAPLSPIETIETVQNAPQRAMATPSPMVAVNTSGGLSREEQATLEEVNRRKQDGDEVIVIMRSRRTPETPSDVIVLNGPSSQFLDVLVNSPPQPSHPSYNPVILSSNPSVPTAGPQPVSFPVKY